MRKNILICLLFIINCSVYGQWQNLNTGITDNIKGVVFFNENGLVAGENGLYYTTTGGVGAASWSPFQITNNATVSDIYENTVFTHCFANKTIFGNSGNAYACGYNTLNNLIVIFKISLPSMTYELLHYGVLSGKLNKIDYNYYDSYFVGVGDNGLIIRFNDFSIVDFSTPTITENLNSISFGDGGYDFSFCSDTKIWNTDFSNAGIYGTVLRNTPNNINKDIYRVSSSNNYSIGDDKYMFSDMSNTNFQPTYCDNFYKPLDANCIFVGNSVFVGTDHGIYRSFSGSSFANDYLEWQVSSQNFSISRFWKQSTNSYYYACGDNGVILRYTNAASATKPYVKLNVNGTCVGSPVLLKAFTGSGNSASWYVNGLLVGTGIAGVNYNFSSAGSYLISVTVQNSFGQVSQDSKTINIVNPPAIDKPISISDVILCEEESIQIQISNSEPNVKYVLKKEGNSDETFGESPTGNGSVVVLNSSLLNSTGNYYIQAVNVLADCSLRFTNNFLITVEKTKSDFHYDLINANPSEVVSYYNKSKEAQNYSWALSSGSGNQSFSTEDIQSSFSATGQSTVSLDAWSNNNCHDVLTKNGPFVVTPPSNQDTCFLLRNDGPDLPWPGYYNKNIAKMKPTSDGGFLTCGAYNNEIFDSKHGVTYDLSNKRGCYLAKHDNNGVLKWVVYTNNLSYPITENYNSANACIQDLQGNIYLTGDSASIFYDNAGNEIDLSIGFGQNTSFLIKLNSKGEFLWRIQSNTLLQFIGIDIDKTNNIILQTQFNNYSYYYQALPMYFNGSLVQNIGDSITATDSNFGLVKISPNGTIIWDTEIYSHNVNTGNGILGIQFDSLNNYYMTLDYELSAKFYSVGNNTPNSLAGDGAYGGKTALVKLNENGIVQWKIRSRTVDVNGNALSTDNTHPEDFYVDSNGDIYISGSNNCNGTFVAQGRRQVFENTDGSTTFTTKGSYFAAKISTNGICEWIRSAGNIYYGYGHQVLKSGNEIFVIGQYYNNGGSAIATAQFDSTNGNNYNLSINKSDYFMAVYDPSGNLKRIIVSGQNTTSFSTQDFVDFIKGQNGNFYLAKNMEYFIGASNFIDFGQVVPQLNEIDGVILRFNEGCGITVYDAVLGLENNEVSSLVSVFPNPTSNQFQINLNKSYEDIQLEIYNVYGKKIKTESIKNSNSINSNIVGDSGVYFIKIILDNQDVNWKKIIKE